MKVTSKILHSLLKKKQLTFERSIRTSLLLQAATRESSGLNAQCCMYPSVVPIITPLICSPACREINNTYNHYIALSDCIFYLQFNILVDNVINFSWITTWLLRIWINLSQLSPKLGGCSILLCSPLLLNIIFLGLVCSLAPNWSKFYDGLLVLEARTKWSYPCINKACLSHYVSVLQPFKPKVYLEQVVPESHEFHVNIVFIIYIYSQFKVTVSITFCVII